MTKFPVVPALLMHRRKKRINSFSSLFLSFFFFFFFHFLMMGKKHNSFSFFPERLLIFPLHPFIDCFLQSFFPLLLLWLYTKLGTVIRRRPVRLDTRTGTVGPALLGWMYRIYRQITDISEYARCLVEALTGKIVNENPNEMATAKHEIVRSK